MRIGLHWWFLALLAATLTPSMLPGLPTHGYGHVWLALPLLFWFKRPEQRRRLLLYVAGLALLALAYPEPDLGFLGWLLLWPYFSARRCEDGASWWRAAFLFGFLRAHLGYHWLGNIHLVAWLGVSVGSSLLFVLCFEGGLRWLRFLPFGLRAATAWLLFESAHAWFVGGFPWLYLSHTQYRYLHVIQAADLVGPYGISFLVAYVSAAAWRRGHVAELATAAVLLCAALGYGFFCQDEDEQEGQPGILMVQSAVPFSVKETADTGSLLQILSQLTDKGLEKHADTDLIIWPETMHPIPLVETLPPYRSAFHGSVLRTARRFRRPMIYGINSYTDLGRFEGHRGHNSAVLVDAKGSVLDLYRKQKLVPMGEEFLPRRVFPDEWCNRWKRWLVENLGYPTSSDLEAGDGYVTLKAGPGLACATLICFEGLYAGMAREALHAGRPDLILHLVNNGWFGHSWEARQSVASWVFRAVETRTPFFSCANGGITCVVGPSGRVLGRVDRVMEEGFLHARVPRRWPDSVFLRVGHMPLAALLALACAVFGVLAARKRRFVEYP